jgi:pimeloyl-ACP methyl ester carboxylesterase
MTGRRVGRILRTALLRLVVLFLLVELALFVFQRKLLYHANTYSSEVLASQSSGEDFRPWPALADYRGLLTEPRDSPVRGTILHLHGNAGSAIDWTDFRQFTRPLGYRLILLEYPGFGARPGNPSETTLAADAARSVELARAQFGAPLFLFGESLGSGVAAATVATAGKQIDGVLLATPWDNLPHVAQETFWFLPVKWLVRDRFDSVRNLADYPGPLAVIMAGKDELIPNRCTQPLYAAFAGRKQMWPLRYATHSTWQDFTNPELWRQAMLFLDAR